MADKLWLRGRVVTPQAVWEQGLVEVTGTQITGVWDLHRQTGPEAYQRARGRGDLPAGGGVLRSDGMEIDLVDIPGGVVCPGFIDLHVHGGGGADFMDADPGAVMQICRFHSRHGTTALLATTLTAPPEAIQAAIGAARQAAAWTGLHAAAADSAGSQVLGFHVEGPFVNPDWRGAQDERYIRPPSVAEAEVWLAAGGDSGHTAWQVTMAPELPGGLAFIRHMTGLGVLVNAGHTGCTYAGMQAAVAAGLTAVTHTFNAMRGLHHREPGTVGAAMDLPQLMAELIADGDHVQPAVMRLLIKSRGSGQVLLVTDAMRAAGQPDGQYRLGGLDVEVAGGRASLPGGVLAGSLLTMDRAVANIHRVVGLPLHEAVQMAALNPARRLGLAGRKGSLEAGKDADIALLDRDLVNRLTMAGGRIVYDGR